MTDAKLTPTQKLKLAEAEIKDLKKLIYALKEQNNADMQTALATHGNEQYQLGFDQGYAQRDSEAMASLKAQSYITRWMYKV